jgi:hypothetical protein
MTPKENQTPSKGKVPLTVFTSAPEEINTAAGATKSNTDPLAEEMKTVAI